MPVQPEEPRMVIASRFCRIRKRGDNDLPWRPLTVSISEPFIWKGGDPTVSVSVSCEYFKGQFPVFGWDDPIKAILNIPLILYAYLSRVQNDGYEICWREPGDIDTPEFWSSPPTGLRDYAAEERAREAGRGPGDGAA